MESTLGRKYRALLVLLVALPAAGCGPGFDANSGGDNAIASAKVVALGQPVTDRLSDRSADNTDWKSFDFDAIRGQISIDLYWDDPEVETLVTLRDQFGARVFEWKHRRGQQHERYPAIRVREGRYFLELRCDGGESVYTLVVRDAESSGAGYPGGSGEPPPE